MKGVFYENTFSTWGCKNCKVSSEVHFCAWHATINVSNAKQVSWTTLIFIRRYLFAEKQRVCCWKLLLTVWTLTFNYSAFKSRPKDVSKACLSLPTTKTHQDKPFWQLSIVTVNLPGFYDCYVLKYIYSKSGLPFNYWAVKSNISVLLGKLVKAKRT